MKVCIKLLLFGLMGWALASCAGETPTPMPTPVVNVHPTVAIAPTAVPQANTAVPVWTSQLSGAINVTPVLSNELVIVATADGQIHAVEAATGARVWTFQSEARIWDASLRVAEGLACVGRQGGLLTCLDAETGRSLWTAKLGIEVQSRPALVNDKIYAPTTWVGTSTPNDYEGRAVLFALDAATGETIWQAETDNFILRRPIVAGDSVVTGGAYLAEEEGEESLNRIYAFDAATGQEHWTHVSDDGLIRWLAAANDVIAFAGRSEVVRGLDPASGELLWSFGPSYWMQFPAVVEDTLFMGTGDERFHALDAATGDQLWERRIDLDALNQIGRPLIRGGLIVFHAVTGDIYALRQADGEQLLHLETGLTARVGGALYDNLYIMGDPEGRLYAFSIGE